MSGSGVSEFFLRDALFADPFVLVPFIIEHQQCYTLERPTQINRWREYVTGVGRVDLLIAWPGVVAVIECKKGVASEGAVAQTLRYMGVLGDIVPDGADLIGFVAAEDFDKLAVSAARASAIGLIRLSPAVTCADGFPKRTVEGGHDDLKAACSWALPKPLPPAPKKHRIRAVRRPLPLPFFSVHALRYAAQKGAVTAVVRFGSLSCALD